MNTVNLIFPHQLFQYGPLLDNRYPIYLIEESLFFNQYHFHKQKMAYHRASMKAYEEWLSGKGHRLSYVEASDEICDVRKLLQHLSSKGIKQIKYIDPVDNWLAARIERKAKALGLSTKRHDTLMFLNSRVELDSFFKPKSKKYFQTRFYIAERKKRKVLLDSKGNPQGGKWSFDAENRKRFPAKAKAPPVSFPKADLFYEEATQYVKTNFADAPGELTSSPLYPYTFKTAKAWLNEFLKVRFEKFGDYEDAIVADESILHHSVLTPMLNVGLLTPKLVLKEALEYADRNNIPINSVEGFVRQIMGWREFIRGVYEVKGVEERTRNYWNFKRKIPKSFYDGSTGIDPVDITIKKVLKSGYCHHINRLMVLGNFMLLCEFDPDDVYRWFMELFIDAYDWVMVPNVYGMSQFADGGLMATKPYVSGSNYLMKMSDYPKGEWQQIWDALFWRFMHVHRDFFMQNPRLGMLVKTFDKMDGEKQQSHLDKAEKFLNAM